ncbi:MAG: hypothetical protein ABSA41_12610 [Terriglobia bacterium]|jgi:hypothetical protein
MATARAFLRHESVSEWFFEWRFRSGLRKIPRGLPGLRVRIEGQPSQSPDYVDIQFRAGKVRRLLRVPLAWLEWLGPRH